LREHRRAQLVQSGKRQLHLRLDTIDLRELETAGLLRDVCHQCCLADSSLAPQSRDRPRKLPRRTGADGAFSIGRHPY
jgi:hypothetical protein